MFVLLFLFVRAAVAAVCAAFVICAFSVVFAAFFVSTSRTVVPAAAFCCFCCVLCCFCYCLWGRRPLKNRPLPQNVCDCFSCCLLLLLLLFVAAFAAAGRLQLNPTLAAFDLPKCQ